MNPHRNEAKQVIQSIADKFRRLRKSDNAMESLSDREREAVRDVGFAIEKLSEMLLDKPTITG